MVTTNIFFLNIVPSNDETSFQPPFMFCISVIIHICTLQFTNSHSFILLKIFIWIIREQYSNLYKNRLSWQDLNPGPPL